MLRDSMAAISQTPSCGTHLGVQLGVSQRMARCWTAANGMSPDFNDSESARHPLQSPPPIPPLSLTGALSPLLLIPMAIPALVALFAPLDVLEVWPAAHRFAQWVQQLLPFINMRGHADSTLFPQVAWLAHSCTVTVIAIMALVWFWQSMVNYPRLLARRRALGPLTIKQHIFITAVGPPLFLGAVYVLVAVPGDPSWGHNFTTHSRAGFAFMSVGIAYCGSAVLGGQPLVIRLFIDQYLKGKQ
jgi:hypothetical protein